MTTKTKLAPPTDTPPQPAEAPAADPASNGRETAPTPDLRDPQYYFNRELSWIEFNGRVLEEAQDPRQPLLERVKFLAIFGSNLDEFFMTRVAGLQDQVQAGVLKAPPDGLTPAAQLTTIRKRLKPMLKEARRHLQNSLLPELAKAGIVLHDFSELNKKQRDKANNYFKEAIFPVLTPLAFDPGRPFPHISNLSLNLAVRVHSQEYGEHFARLKLPPSLPRLVPVPHSGSKIGYKRFHFVWLEQLIIANIHTLFPGMNVLEAYPFRVTRSADIEIQEDEASDLLLTIEDGLRRRRFGPVVRMTIAHTMPDHIRDLLTRNLRLDAKDIFPVDGPLGLSDLMDMYSAPRYDLKDQPYIPAIPTMLRNRAQPSDIFNIIRQQDVLLHHPYDSFLPVVDFLRAAARDPNVLAIKQTLYRVGRDSPIVKALMEARENGKEVAVLIELKARFDEGSNIGWARALERVGVHVVYGLVGLKTHSKVTLVIRKEPDGLRRYLHLGTGNYNDVTAQIYTDLGIFTANESLGNGASDLFNRLTGYSNQSDYGDLLVAPVNLRHKILAMIEREISKRSPDNPGHLIFKMNALVDAPMIRALYRASQAGVKVDLIVRGICCLRPGVEGVSENIRVISIVGRFLEHSRIFYFKNGGDEEIYLGSADLMPRNLNGRVETVFPVFDPALRQQIREEVLGTCLSDDRQARLLLSDGVYERLVPRNDQPALCCQTELMRRAKLH
ncbi:MAG TPA: polyphosphate kinase 1 [Chloroflexi bacterium]|nr:polyphosphate kinase 1 [Chloroflexota bacterium]